MHEILDTVYLSICLFKTENRESVTNACETGYIGKDLCFAEGIKKPIIGDIQAMKVTIGGLTFAISIDKAHEPYFVSFEYIVVEA